MTNVSELSHWANTWKRIHVNLRDSAYNFLGRRRLTRTWHSHPHSQFSFKAAVYRIHAHSASDGNKTLFTTIVERALSSRISQRIERQQKMWLNCHWPEARDSSTLYWRSAARFGRLYLLSSGTRPDGDLVPTLPQYNSARVHMNISSGANEEWGLFIKWSGSTRLPGPGAECAKTLQMAAPHEERNNDSHHGWVRPTRAVVTVLHRRWMFTYFFNERQRSADVSSIRN